MAQSAERMAQRAWRMAHGASAFVPTLREVGSTVDKWGEKSVKCLPRVPRGRVSSEQILLKKVVGGVESLSGYRPRRRPSSSRAAA